MCLETVTPIVLENSLINITVRRALPWPTFLLGGHGKARLNVTVMELLFIT